MSVAISNVPPRAAKVMERQASAIERMKDRGKRTAETVGRTAGAAATGAVLGFVEGRFGRSHVGKLPISIGVGIAAHVTAFAAGGRYAGTLHSIGDGALAVGAYKFGTEVGAERRHKAQNTHVGGVAQMHVGGGPTNIYSGYHPHHHAANAA